MINIKKRTQLPRVTTLATCLAITLAGGSGACAYASNAASLTQLQHGNYIPARAMPLQRPGAGNGPLVARDWKQPLSIPAAQAASVVPVLNCNDSGSGSLREAAVNAVSNDEIDLRNLSCSTISLTSGAITTSAYKLTLAGPGATNMTIAGNGSDSILVGNTLVVTGLTIYNGTNSGGSGGCIYASSDLTLIDSIVTKCHSGGPAVTNGYGGGVTVLGVLRATDSAITYSTAQGSEKGYGGGAFVYGDVYMVRSSILGNTAISETNNASGGGIHGKEGVRLWSSTVAGNKALSNNGSALGGGISTFEGDVEVLLDSRVTGNEARSKRKRVTGGGISAGSAFSFPGDILLERSVLSGNSAITGCGSCSSYGGGAHAIGGIAAYYSEISGNTLTTLASSNAHALGGGLSTLRAGTGGFVLLVSSTVSGNASVGGGGSSGSGIGGGIGPVYDSPVELHNSTVAFNSATTHSGGVKVGSDGDSASKFKSSIVAMNEAVIGADIGSNSVQTVEGLSNLVMQAAANVTLPVDTLSVDPLLQPLASNGSSRYTHAINEYSPAFDTGERSWDHITTYDQRGEPYVRKSGVAEDIGAFELQYDPDQIFDDGFELLSTPHP